MDVAAGKAVRSFADNASAVSAACFVGDSVALAFADGAIEIWDKSMGSVPRHLRGHVGPVHCVVATDNLLVSGGRPNHPSLERAD